jgi:hypothetical protein
LWIVIRQITLLDEQANDVKENRFGSDGFNLFSDLMESRNCDRSADTPTESGKSMHETDDGNRRETQVNDSLTHKTERFLHLEPTQE